MSALDADNFRDIADEEDEGKINQAESINNDSRRGEVARSDNG